MRIAICFLALLSAVPALFAQNISNDDAAAIRKPALDYIEGWYEGNAARMESALHPELAKRALIVDLSTGRSRLDSMSAMTLVQRRALVGEAKLRRTNSKRTSPSWTGLTTRPSSKLWLRSGWITCRK